MKIKKEENFCLTTTTNNRKRLFLLFSIRFILVHLSLLVLCHLLHLSRSISFYTNYNKYLQTDKLPWIELSRPLFSESRSGLTRFNAVRDFCRVCKKFTFCIEIHRGFNETNSSSSSFLLFLPSNCLLFLLFYLQLFIIVS